MGKRRRKKGNRSGPEGEKPYCWYCDRYFLDDKILVQHQRQRHFKCTHCPKKLSTASGFVIHAFHVHKVTIDRIPNAKPGRDNVKELGLDPNEPDAKRQRVDGNVPNNGVDGNFGGPNQNPIAQSLSQQHPLPPHGHGHGLLPMGNFNQGAPIPPSMGIPPVPPQMAMGMGRPMPMPSMPMPPGPMGMPMGMGMPPGGLMGAGMGMPMGMRPPVAPTPQPLPQFANSNSYNPISGTDSVFPVQDTMSSSNENPNHNIQPGLSERSSIPSSANPTPSMGSNMVLIYADPEVSMEERRASLSRYQLNGNEFSTPVDPRNYRRKENAM